MLHNRIALRATEMEGIRLSRLLTLFFRGALRCGAVVDAFHTKSFLFMAFHHSPVTAPGRTAMKKPLATAAISALLAFSLSGCANEASQVSKAIDGIGEITLESQSAINDAQEKYDALTDEDKGKVANYSKLEEAQEEYLKILSEDTKSLIDNARELSTGSFANFCDTDSLNKLNSATEKASEALETGNVDAISGAHSLISQEVDSFNSYIEDLEKQSQSKQTNNGEFPYSVEESDLRYGICMSPVTKHDSSYPYYVAFSDRETTDKPITFDFQVNDEVLFYSCELVNEPTTLIEVQDKDGNLQKAFVNTRAKLTKYQQTNASLYPLGDNSVYFYYDKNKGISLAIEDLNENQGFLTYSWSY